MGQHFKPEHITLMRTPIGRTTGSKMAGVHLLEMAKKEGPYIGAPYKDFKDNELWAVEKQWWLKHKKAFQRFGFMPMDAWNKNKDIHQMMENY